MDDKIVLDLTMVAVDLAVEQTRAKVLREVREAVEEMAKTNTQNRRWVYVKDVLALFREGGRFGEEKP
jgi:hypothetical protein